MGPVDPVVQKIVVAVSQPDEFCELNEEPDASGYGREAKHREDDVDAIERRLHSIFFRHGERWASVTDVRAWGRLSTEWDGRAAAERFCLTPLLRR